MKESYVSVNWPAPGKVGAVMTTRLGGVSDEPYQSFNLGTHVGDQEAIVLQNRKQLINDQQLESVVWLNQVHGTDTLEIKRNVNGESVPTADASYTRVQGIACAVLVADCMPVLITDKEGSCVGVAHAGWRGLCSGVIPRLITKMDLEPEQTFVWLGPCIGSEAFEVGPEVLKEFQLNQSFGNIDVLPAFRPIFKNGTGDRYIADLVQLAKMQLAGIGVQGVFAEQECTYSDAQKYFSYRRDGVTGRMAALIWIKNQ